MGQAAKRLATLGVPPFPSAISVRSGCLPTALPVAAFLRCLSVARTCGMLSRLAATTASIVVGSPPNAASTAHSNLLSLVFGRAADLLRRPW